MSYATLVAQIRGTGYAAAEIVWWMVAALLIGVAIGWILRSFRAERTVAEEYEGRLALAEERAGKMSGELAEADAATRRATEEAATVRTELASARDQIARLTAELHEFTGIGEANAAQESVPTAGVDAPSDHALAEQTATVEADGE